MEEQVVPLDHTQDLILVVLDPILVVLDLILAVLHLKVVPHLEPVSQRNLSQNAHCSRQKRFEMDKKFDRPNFKGVSYM